MSQTSATGGPSASVSHAWQVGAVMLIGAITQITLIEMPWKHDAATFVPKSPICGALSVLFFLALSYFINRFLSGDPRKHVLDSRVSHITLIFSMIAMILVVLDQLEKQDVTHYQVSLTHALGLVGTITGVLIAKSGKLMDYISRRQRGYRAVQTDDHELSDEEGGMDYF